MRWGSRALAVLLAASVVVGGCSSSHKDASKNAAAQPTTTSTSSSTTTTVGATTLATAVGAGSGGSSQTSTKAAAPATTRPPTTTTTRATCFATVSRSAPALGTDNPNDSRAASVTLQNQHTGSVVVTIRGASYSLAPGGSRTISLAPIHQGEVVTAAATSAPTDRFSYSIQPLPNTGYTLSVKTMDIGTCDAGIRRTVYLREDGVQIHG